MVLINELWDQSGANIEQILSSLKQDLPELERQILETFHQMRESLQPVHHLFDGLDLDSIPENISSQELQQWLFKKSQGSKEEGELVEAASSNNGLELSVEQANYEYQGVLLPSRLKQMETIWELLNNDRVGTIGIMGEHGMGKTWMVVQLKERAIKAKLFDTVIELDMKYRKDLLEAQMYIVDQLRLSRHFSDEMDFNRAVALSLGKKKCLFILYDIQFEVDLSKLGFSEPWKQNVSSKVLLSGTTRILDRIQKDRTFWVDPLNDEEALLLFLGKTGLDIDSPYVIEVARPLVASFQGSVREIVWFGGDDVAELTNRVCHLLNSGKMEVIQCLRSCCYLFTEDRNIKVKDLIAWWIIEILVVDCLGLDEAYEKAQHILQELIDCKFLVRVETEVQLKTKLVTSHLNLDSFINNIIPPWEFKNKRSIVMNEKFKFEDSDDDDRATELLLMYGKKSYLPRCIRADFFLQEMQNLNTLAILNAGIVSLPESLSNLKHLELLVIKGCTSLENLNPIRGLKKLERLCISGASRLREIPDDIFENIDKLVELHLSNAQLKQLPFSFSKLGNIKTLILRGCSRLESLPPMEPFHKLSVLDLSGASVLTSIPNILYSSLKTLDLSRTLIETLPSSSNLESLVQIFLRGCTKITTMQHPNGYKSLEVVDLSGATSFRDFQGGITIKVSKIDLSGTQIAQVPFFGTGNITELLLRNCVHLETMPYLFIKFEVLDLSGSIAFMNFDDAPLPDQLRKLDLSRTQIGKLPVFSMHSSILHLILRECRLLEELPHLELQRLQVLDLSGSTKFKTFKDDSFDKLRKLKTLDISETQVANLPTLTHCSELRHLIMRKCSKLEELPHLNTLEKLELLDLSGAISFKQFKDESFGKKEELYELNLSETQVAHIPSLPECHNIRKLILGGCSKLEILPKMEVLSRLVVLDLSGISLIKHHHFQFIDMKYDSLQVLDLSGTHVSDLSFITGCRDLRQLSLRDMPNIKTWWPPFENLIKLKKLDLSRTKTSELSFLSGCKSLCQLLLNDCSNIQELTSLKEHTRLEVLDLSGTKIDDLSVLTGFNKLFQLSLIGCPNLKTLSFEGMQNLQKLNLSHSPIKLLPSSFFGIKNLHTLLLTNCSSLETLPHMEFLPKLEVLDLSCTNVREFPNGISTLTHLRFLKLQEENSLWEFHNGKSFEKFHFCLFAPKERIGENDIYLQGQQYSFKDIYYQTSHIPSITEEPDKFFKICGFRTFPAGIKEVLVHVELLYLKKNNFIKRLSDLGAENVNNMRECWIENCDSMEVVFYGEEEDEFLALRGLFSMEEEVDEIVEDETVAFGRCLQNIWVSKLLELKSLFGGVVQPGSFTLLKHLYIECCPSLITVFSYHLKLKNLEVLKIKFCDKIEGIYGETVLGEETLPKLKTLILFKLPKLQSICGGVLASLINLRVIGCTKIKRLPVCRKTTSPVKIKGEEVWWNDLEWEDEGTKSQQRFSPF